MNIIRFFVRNSVAVSLLGWTLIIGGVISASRLRREFFPEITSDAVAVMMSYQGASPAEIEDSLGRKVEDAMVDLEGLDRITTAIFDGRGSVAVKFKDGVNLSKRAEDMQRAVDAMQDLPVDAERLRVVEIEAKMPAIQIAITGDVDEQVLKSSVRRVEDDLRAMRGMGTVVVNGVREYEVRVEVDRTALLRHGISLNRVSDAVGQWMREIGGGSLRSADASVSIRTLGTPETVDAISDIIVRSDRSGSVVRVRDIGVVAHTFVEQDVLLRVNGNRGATITIFKSLGQDVVRMANLVRGYVAARQGREHSPSGWALLMNDPFSEGWDIGHLAGPLPVQLATSTDLAKIIEDRFDLLSRNALQGAGLLFLALLLGVSLRSAWWVMVGIGTAICGTLLVMSLTGVTLNLITMFGLLLVMGMMDDDAIVINESIETLRAEGLSAEAAAVGGVQRVMWPVLGSAATAIVAFVPLGLLRGRVGDLMGELPTIVTIALCVSVVETLLLAPAHQAGSIRRREALKKPGFLERLCAPLEGWRDRRAWPSVTAAYGRAAGWCVEHRYMSVSGGIAIFIVSIGMVAGGQLAFTFLPTDDAETLLANYSLSMGSPLSRTTDFAKRVETAARSQAEVKSVISIIGETVNFESGGTQNSSSNVGQIVIELLPLEKRGRSSSQVLDSIRAELGRIDEVERLSWGEISGGPGGPDITYELAGDDRDALTVVSKKLRETLLSFSGVLDASDNDESGAPEIQVDLRAGASAAGFTPIEIAAQLRAAVHGQDAHVFTEHGEDIDVRVSLDQDSRAKASLIEDAWVVSPAGRVVPVSEVARITETAGYASVRRLDRKRSVAVMADCSAATIPEDIVRALEPTLVQLRADYPDVSITTGGRQRDLEDAFGSLPIAVFASLAMIYVILAWLFRSFIQPFAVMVAIPFGLIGVVWGHLALGYDLTFLSIIGVVGLSGVVVNNSLVLIEFSNANRAIGLTIQDSLVLAGRQRLRAVILTTLTTVVGLAPLISEQSFQARFLVPMAISLCGGLISSTGLTLLLLPAILVVFSDIGQCWHFLWSGRPMRDHSSASA